MTMGRESIRLVEIDRTRCALTFGESPCQGELGVTGTEKCTNALVTCHDTPNFTPETATDRFSMDQEGVLAYAPVVPSLLDAPTTPARINLGGMDRSAAALGQREVVNLVFADHRHSGLGHDPYRLERITGDASLLDEGTAGDPSSDDEPMDDFLVLSPGAPASFPEDAVLRLVSGPGSVQERPLAAYNGTTKVATVASGWSVNLVRQSEDLDTAPWTDNLVGAIAAGDVPPAPYTKSWKNTSEGTSTYIGSMSVTLVAATAYRLTVAAKKGTANRSGVSLHNGTTHQALVDFNWSADGVPSLHQVTVGSASDITFTPIGLGFYEIAFTVDSDADGGTHQVLLYIDRVAGTGLTHYTGPHLRPAAVADAPYIRTGASAITLPDDTTSYEVREAFDPYQRGTFWGKYIARNPYHVGAALRVYDGEMGDALADMRVRHYVVDRIEGPSDGKVKIVAKDVFSKIEARKAVAPRASRGELSADLTGTPGSFSVLPAGIGDLDYEREDTSIDSIYVAIGDEIIRCSRSGDTFTILERGALNTEQSDHDEEDLVQLVLVYEADRPHNIAYDLLVNYSDIDPSLINKSEWDTLAAKITELFTARIAEPTPVSDLLGELCEQAGFTLWPDVSTGMIKFRALRAGAVSPTVDDDGWIVEGTLSVKRQEAKRVSQVHVYYGQKTPVEALDDRRNYHSRLIVTGTNNYDTEAIKEVFSRWIPQFGRNAAERCGERLFNMFKDPPLEASLAIHVSRDGDLGLARYFFLETADVQDAMGLPKPTAMAAIELDRGEHEIGVMAQAVTFGDDPEDGERAIPIENDTFDFHMRTVHDSLYAAPGAGTDEDTVRVTVISGVVVGSTDVNGYAIQTGTWPS